jgi:Glycosyl hydrolase family 10
MGVLKFRLVPADMSSRLADLRKAYVTGPDRTPGRSSVEVRPGQLMLHRDNTESGRFHVPWPVMGHGEPVISTATLSERNPTYDLAVELARGKLNDVQNQTFDWRQMGLAVPSEVEDHLRAARKSFARAVTSRDRPADAAGLAAKSLEESCQAARLVVDSYTNQLLRRRLEHGSPLPTTLACGLDGVTKGATWASSLREIFQVGRVRMTWSSVAPDEGKKRWDEPDAQVQWAKKQGMAIAAGPLIEFRAGAIPDWLWLWEGDYEEIQAQAVEYVRQVITRYGNKVATWHLVHRPAGYDILKLSEEEQIRLTAQIVQVARRMVPDAQLVVDLDRPWAEWMAGSTFQLGPLHLADSLARAELGLGGIGLEIAPAYSPLGSHLRDLLDLSRLLDLFALVNLPLHVSFAFPSAATPDPLAAEGVKIAAGQWPRAVDEKLQCEWAASWVALATAKPFVRSVTWLQASDAVPHLFPHAGLVRPDGGRKLAFDWFAGFRKRIS